MSTVLDSKVPPGPLEQKWDSFKLGAKLIAPNNKRKYTVLVVGTGLAGASAAAMRSKPSTSPSCGPTPTGASRSPCPARSP